jgi:hypothetical protein
VMDKWRAFVESLPEAIAMQQAPPPASSESDDAAAFAALMEQLPPNVAEFLSDSAEAPDTAPPSRAPMWCFADMPDGDFPRVYSFPTLRSMLAAIARRDGKDTAVWPFYGFPFQLTKPVTGSAGRSRRYLQLDTSTSVLVANLPDVEVLRPEMLTEELEFEEEGWLGDPELRRKQYFMPGFEDVSTEAEPDIDENDS